MNRAPFTDEEWQRTKACVRQQLEERGLDPAGMEMIVDCYGQPWVRPRPTEPPEPSFCGDCGMDTTPCNADGDLIEGASEWYMVHDHVWRAGMENGGTVDFLCIGCLEQRVGRRLKPSDFWPHWREPRPCHTDRLADRMGHSRSATPDGSR